MLSLMQYLNKVFIMVDLVKLQYTADGNVLYN